MTAVVGAVIILVVLFVAGPIALFVGGMAWSALTGQLLAADADERAAAGAGQPSTSA